MKSTKRMINIAIAIFMAFIVMFPSVAFATGYDEAEKQDVYPLVLNDALLLYEAAIEATDLHIDYFMPINEIGHNNIAVLDNIEVYVNNVIENVLLPLGSRFNDALDYEGIMIPFSNNNPNAAIFISDGMMNQWLSNSSTANESWYFFFVNAGAKLTVALEQPSGGIYVTVLYRMVGNSLIPVTYSMYATTNMRQQFSYIAPQSNAYFLQVIPIVPAQGFYDFAIVTSTVFDSAEADDNQLDARVRSLPATLNQSLDNPIDIDWIRFTTGNMQLLEVTLSNVPAGAVYSFMLFDSNLNVLASFTSAGNASRTWIVPTHTTFYAMVTSQNGGYSATQYYRLSIRSLPLSNYDMEFSVGGNRVGFIGNRMYVNGNNVRLTGSVMHHRARTIPVSGISVVRDQQFVANNGITGLVVHNNPWDLFASGVYRGVIFTDPSTRVINYTNAIMFRVSGVFYFYSHFVSPATTVDSYTSVVFDNQLVVVDANTGRIIDFPQLNMLYRRYGHMPTWNGQNLFN